MFNYFFPALPVFPRTSRVIENSVCHAEKEAETNARQITFAPGSGACRGLWAYKTPQGVPCHEPKTSADMIGADCEKKVDAPCL